MTVNIRGKEYVTVNERVAAVHEDEGAEFEIVNAEHVTIGDTGRWWYVVTIRVHGRLFTGTAEIKFNAKPGTADHDAPVECAETSAIGRALGFAGYGVVDSIASADEMARAQPAQAVQNAPRSHEDREDASDGEWNYLADLRFRQTIGALGYKTLEQAQQLVEMACGGEGAPVSRAKVREFVREAQRKARTRQGAGA